MRLVDWYLGLATGQKVVVGTVALVLVLALTYLASIVILLAAGVGSEGSSPQGEEPVPVSSTPSSSASASAFANTTLEVEKARWRGDVAVVEGKWQGDLSSVHCDLLEGSSSGQVTDWWDRSVAARISLSDRTFSQEFFRAGGDVKQPLDPKREYWATCWAQFSGGLATGDEILIKGTPPAG